MKKNCFGFLILLVLQCAGLFVYGQKTSADNRIAEVYAGYAKELSPEQSAWVKNELSRSEIRKEAYSKNENYPLLSSVPLMNKHNPQITTDDFSKPLEVNPIKYSINFMERKDQKFRIDGTDYVLFVAGKK